MCQVLWAEQQFEIRRVKRDFVHDKREEERAYRQARYDDENWTRQWYLVRRSLQATCALSTLAFFGPENGSQSATNVVLLILLVVIKSTKAF